MTQTNLQRLHAALKKDSLAARLVTAQISAEPGGRHAALKKVLADRLNELRQAHAGTPPQQA